MRKLPCLLVVALTAFNVLAEPELKGTPAELTRYLDALPGTVRLSGESELKQTADRAVVSLNVVTEKALLQEALRLNQEIRAKVLNTLKERGLPADRVQASKFSSTPKYGLFGEKAKSYRVENIIKITAQDEKEFQVVAKLVDSTPEIRYDRIEFEHSDKEGMKTRALAQAMDKANEKKKFYEEKLGVKLTPRNFTESTPTPEPLQDKRYGYGKASSGYDLSARESGGGNAPPAEDLPNSFGELVFKASVTVEYTVAGK